MRSVMALAFIVYALWTVWSVLRTAPAGRMTLARFSLGVFVLLSPLVWLTVRQPAGEDIYPLYEWVWLAVLVMAGVLALLLRRHPARAALWGVLVSGTVAYLAVFVLFELGISPPLDLAP